MSGEVGRSRVPCWSVCFLSSPDSIALDEHAPFKVSREVLYEPREAGRETRRLPKIPVRLDEAKAGNGLLGYEPVQSLGRKSLGSARVMDDREKRDSARSSMRRVLTTKRSCVSLSSSSSSRPEVTLYDHQDVEIHFVVLFSSPFPAVLLEFFRTSPG